MDRNGELNLPAVDEDEGSCPQKQVNRAANSICHLAGSQTGKIERSAEAFRASHCPPSFPPNQLTHNNTARATGQIKRVGGAIAL